MPAEYLPALFAAAFKSLHKFTSRDEAAFYRYLGSIAEHLIWNAAQKKHFSRLAVESDREEGGVDISPSKGLRRNERFDRLEKALSDLTADHRTVIVMARLRGLSMKEIAHKMNRSPDAVKKLLARALLQLRRSFGDDTESLHLPHRRFKVEEEDGDE